MEKEKVRMIRKLNLDIVDTRKVEVEEVGGELKKKTNLINEVSLFLLGKREV
jgi:hypothetical protein